MNYESVQTGKALCESQCMNFGGDVSLVANLHRCFLERSVPSPHLLMHCQGERAISRSLPAAGVPSVELILINTHE